MDLQYYADKLFIPCAIVLGIEMVAALLFGVTWLVASKLNARRVITQLEKVLPFVFPLLIFSFWWLFILAGFMTFAFALIVVAAGTWMLIRTVDGSDEHEHPHDEPPRVLSRIKSRIIAIRTMDTPLRLITVVSIALLFAAGLLLVFPTGGSPIHIGVDGVDNLVMQPLAFWISLAIYILGCAFLLSSALVDGSGWLVILPVVSYLSAPGTLSRGPLIAWLIYVVPLWGWALIGFFLGRRKPEVSTKQTTWGIRFLSIGLLAAWTFAHTLINWQLGIQNASPFAPIVTAQFFRLILCLIPLLFLAGADFADIGYSISAGLGGALTRKLPGIISLALAALVAGAILWINISRFPLSVAETVVAAAFALITVYLLVAAAASFYKRNWWTHEVSYPTLLVCALVLAGSYEVLILYSSQSLDRDEPVVSFTVFKNTEQPHFSIAYPRSWTVLSRKPFEADGGNDRSSITVTATPVAPPERAQYQEGNKVHPTDSISLWQVDRDLPPQDAAFRRFVLEHISLPGNSTFELRYAGKGGYTYEADFDMSRHVWKYWAYLKYSDGYIWTLQTSYWKKYNAHFLPIFTREADSFRTDLSATAAPDLRFEDTRKYVVEIFNFPGAPIMLGLAGIAAIVILSSKEGRAERARKGSLFFGGHIAAILLPIVVGILGCFQLSYGFSADFQALPHPSQLLELTAGSATLLALPLIALFPSCRQWLPHLTTLNLGLIFLDGVYWLYGNVIQVGERSVIAQSAVLVIALLWDLAMSGKDVTNVDRGTFRRHVRVMIYLGCMLLVCSAVVYHSSEFIESNGSHVEAFFEAENIVRQGIMWLGIPLLVTNFLFGLRAIP